MTTSRKVIANRKNASASTGPRSKSGKARSAMNARRHGLSIPILSDPNWSGSVRNLALKFLGENANDEQRELAYQIAAAQIDIVRVRQARLNLLKQNLADENFQSRLGAKVSKIVGEHLARNKEATIPSRIANLMRKPTGDDKLGTIVSELFVELMRLDRYERRALSRRKFAIRDFDAVRRPCTDPSGP